MIHPPAKNRVSGVWEHTFRNRRQFQALTAIRVSGASEINPYARDEGKLEILGICVSPALGGSAEKHTPDTSDTQNPRFHARRRGCPAGLIARISASATSASWPSPIAPLRSDAASTADVGRVSAPVRTRLAHVASFAPLRGLGHVAPPQAHGAADAGRQSWHAPSSPANRYFQAPAGRRWPWERSPLATDLPS